MRFSLVFRIGNWSDADEENLIHQTDFGGHYGAGTAFAEQEFSGPKEFGRHFGAGTAYAKQGTGIYRAKGILEDSFSDCTRL